MGHRLGPSLLWNSARALVSLTSKQSVTTSIFSRTTLSGDHQSVQSVLSITSSSVQRPHTTSFARELALSIACASSTARPPDPLRIFQTGAMLLRLPMTNVHKTGRPALPDPTGTSAQASLSCVTRTRTSLMQANIIQTSMPFCPRARPICRRRSAQHSPPCARVQLAPLTSAWRVQH